MPSARVGTGTRRSSSSANARVVSPGLPRVPMSMSTNSLVLSTFASNAIDKTYHSGKLASMSIDDDLAMLLSKLPEPETLTSKGPTWPAAVHLIVRVLLAIRADMQWPKERGRQAQAAPGRTWTDVERQRVAGLLSAAFGTTGPIEEQVAVIRGLLQGARMEANATLRDTAECRGSLHRIGIAHDEGVKLWRSADPERRSMMLPPMRAELVVWLLEQLTEARLDAAGRQELERQVQHEQARWARIQPVIRALHSWEVHGPDSEKGLASAFETWQRTEAAALDGEHVKPRGPLTRAEAAEIARRAASGPNRPSYYAEPFEPHLWVVDALIMLDRELRSAVLTEDVASAAPTSGPTLCNGQHEAPGMAAPFVPCDREHTAPACPDAQCWRREKSAEVTAPGKVSARPAEGATHQSLPEAVHRLADYIERFANRIEEDSGHHGVFRVVLFPDAALRYGVAPGNSLVVRVGAGDVEVTTTGVPSVEVKHSDPTTASIEASNHARADLRERLDAANAQTKEWMEQCRAAETEVRRLGDELGNLRAHVATVTGERNQAMALANDACRERTEALAQRQKLLDDGLAARLLADAMLEAVKPLLPNGCKLDPDSIRVAIGDYVSGHNNLVHAVKVLAEDL